MLKKIRVILALIIFCVFSFYFLDFAEILPWQVHGIGHIQFVPALISGSLGILAFLIIFTLLFGRIYCSVICPMGIFQDIIIRLRRKKKFAFKKNNRILRISILLLTIIFFFAGFTIVLSLLDPYSAYGRFAVHLFKPVYLAANNVLTSVFNYSFYKMEIFIPSLFAFIVAIVTFIIVVILAWTNGRLYCNTICPVGTILGFLNKFSFFKIRINNDKCSSCGMCAKQCKAQCIDAKNKIIDYSRCVNCFNCINNCKKGGIAFRRGAPLWSPFSAGNKNTEPVDIKKRNFLKKGVIAAAALPSVAALAKSPPLSETNSTAIAPPGARSIEKLKWDCTSCHLCISKCPSNVLKPAFMQYGVGGMMMPVMYFEKGFCNYDCVECTRVCPNGALENLSVEEKHLTQVGKVIFKRELCVPITEGTSCGACAEHCPTQAVRMVPFKDGLTIPEIDQEICVGCGGCEFICPVRPQRAIYVQGNAVHQKAKPFAVEKVEEKEITDFGF